MKGVVSYYCIQTSKSNSGGRVQTQGDIQRAKNATWSDKKNSQLQCGILAGEVRISFISSSLLNFNAKQGQTRSSVLPTIYIR